MQLDRRSKKTRKGRALEALTKSALALPGLAGMAPLAHADAPTDAWEVDFSGSWYKEADLSKGQWAESLGGSTERYSIQAYQLGVKAPVTSQIDVSVDLVFETMSGASPWYVLRERDAVAGSTSNRPLAAMTGATIEDTRIDGQFTVNHYFDRARLSMSGGFSTENDYGSGNFGFSAERSYNDKNTTLAGSASFSWDTIRPTDPTEHGHPADASYGKKTRTVSASIAQILTRTTVMQLGYTFKNNNGFLSDPYKEFYFTLAQDRQNDSRPDVRNQHTLLARLRQHLDRPNASLSVDLQGYFDSWDIRSFGMTAAWYQTLGDDLQLIPSVRYYSQSQPYFYALVLEAQNQPYYSSDYRLSAFGALQGGVRLEWKLDRLTKWATWHLGLGYDYYWSSEKFALRRVDQGNPGLVRWGLLSGQISGRF